MSKILVFDLETKKTFDEVGGSRQSHLLGVSVCGVYDYATDSYRAYKENELEEMENLFSQADLLVGFNSKHFDNKVLQPYFKKLQLESVAHLDILEQIIKQLGFRLKLESVAQSTLYTGKSGSGLDAIRYFRQQDWENLIKYCLDDVRVTKEVYEYGRDHGRLWYTSGGKFLPIKASWQQEPVIYDRLAEALTNKKQLEIEYIKVDNDKRTTVKRVVDIKAMDKEKIRVFDHTAKGERIFSIAKILRLKTLGEMDSFQPSLI